MRVFSEALLETRLAEDMEATQVPINRQLDEKAVARTCKGILLSHKENKILPFATAWMNLESITLSEISQPEKDKMPYDFTYRWNLMSKINKQNRNRLIRIENRLMDARGEEFGGDWVKKMKGLRSTDW
ncbi:hypothetical protein HJG60_009342 [Phyllostomus discolor]|uniref:Uncharacterized protein n=1 Tax=Phyllostomus discolor TaxID=89673 RepID=A0A834DDH0_9CHIR|nr:hypothetical protein HJG60_009342 [Phyllostomus discolor]